MLKEQNKDRNIIFKLYPYLVKVINKNIISYILSNYHEYFTIALIRWFFMSLKASTFAYSS